MMNIFVHKTLEGVCFHNLLTKHSKVSASTTCLQNMQMCLLSQHAYKTFEGACFHNMLPQHAKVSASTTCLQNMQRCLLPQHAYKLDNGFLDIFLIQSPFFLQGILYSPNYTFFYKKTIFFCLSLNFLNDKN